MLLFCDGFDHYTSLPGQKWDVAINAGSPKNPSNTAQMGISSLAARSGGQGLRIPSLVQNYLQKNLGKNVVTGILGFAFNATAAPSANQVLASFMDGTTAQVDLQLLTTGFLIASRGIGTLLGTSSQAITFNSWHYIEFLATIDPSAGVIGIKLDGVQVLSLTSQNTAVSANSSFNTLAFGSVAGFGGSNPLFFDDLYMCDATGSFNNTYLGDVQVQALLPYSNGTETDFSKGGSTINANNFQQVYEEPPDDDTSYVASSTVGNIDRYLYAPAVPTQGTPYAAVVWCRGRKDDAAVRSARLVVKSGATLADNGADIPLSGGYQYMMGVFETDPNTSAAWTLPGLANAEFGVKVTA